MSQLFILICCCLLGSGQTIEEKLYQGLKNYMQTGNKSADLENTWNKITQNNPAEIQNAEKKSLLSSASDETICTICTVVARLLITYRDLNLSIDALKTGLKYVCKFFQTENVCNGAIELNAVSTYFSLSLNIFLSHMLKIYVKQKYV